LYGAVAKGLKLSSSYWEDNNARTIFLYAIKLRLEPGSKRLGRGNKTITYKMLVKAQVNKERGRGERRERHIQHDGKLGGHSTNLLKFLKEKRKKRKKEKGKKEKKIGILKF
jgi:hypothetical protein